jgi:small subunit ribosomal protein S6
MVILDPNKYAQDPNGLGAQIPNLVAKSGGEVLVSRLWNEQKMTYPIEGHKKGTYWLTYFRMDSGKKADFDREVRLSETILRCLTLKVDPRLVDDLVAHAKGEKKAAPPPEAGASAPAEAGPEIDAEAEEAEETAEATT